MGWTYQHASFFKKNGQIDRKAELDHEFTESSEFGTWEILKSTMVGTVYYAACRRTKKGEGSEVFAIIALTHVASNDYCNFGYKDMTDKMGPYECDCPENILSLLSETDNEYALAWRQRCRERRKERAAGNPLSKLPVGSIIKFKYGEEEKMLQKCAPAYQFKRPWWCVVGEFAYMSQKRIPRNFTVVS